MVSVQNSSNTSLVVEVVVESKNFADFLQRMNAVSTILEADKRNFTSTGTRSSSN